MKSAVRFFRRYRLFSIALLALIASLILVLLKQKTASNIVLSVVALGETLPLIWDMWQDLKTGRYGIDILAATAIIASVILGQYWAGIVVVLMLTGGKSLEDFAEHRAQSELDALLKHSPQTAHVIRKGKTLKVPVDSIKPGEKIVIRPGEVVPVDALIIEGQANFDESSLTGESLPQTKEKGSQLLSGSINIDGAVTAKALASAADSQYQQIIKLVKSASASQAPFVRLADRYSLPFTLAAYAIAVALWVVTGQAIRFLEVIIVATPCPLLLAAPIALISGMARASRYGVIVRNGTALEKLAETSVIAFDKTGTLTKGELTVQHVKAYAKQSEDKVLRLAASLEQNSNHVLAQAIVTDAKLKGIKLLKSKHLEEAAGLGIKASIKGDEILVGNMKFMEREKVKVPSSIRPGELNKTAAYVAENGTLAGVITFTDEVRAEAAHTLKYLHELGVKDIVMITGDNKDSAEAIAKHLSIDKVHAESMPADKLHIVSKLKPKPVAFVGDGVNDAPVLTTAGVGIALGAKGSTAASESADMVIMLDDLSRVAVALEIAKKTFKIASQSIIVGIALSLVLMGIFATGKFPPLAGALLQEVVDVVVIFNALRAHIIKPSMIHENNSNS